jgi:hypothetical protein
MIVQTIIKVQPESQEEDDLIKQEAEIIDDIRPVLNEENKFPVYIVTEAQLKQIRTRMLLRRGPMG